MNLNEVKIAGNLVRKPELCHTSQGTAIVDISLGINEAYTNSEGEKHQVTTFVDVQIWGESAEALVKHVEKGEQLFVSGPLRQSTWKDPETGKNRSKLFIKAESWQFVQYKASEAQREAGKAQSQGMER
jgi:single-strand DNA-binding protein